MRSADVVRLLLIEIGALECGARARARRPMGQLVKCSKFAANKRIRCAVLREKCWQHFQEAFAPRS